MTLPTEVPVMVLPGATLFPSTTLPLLIFEDRYRSMLAHVLETHRMFSVALMKPGGDEPASESDFFQGVQLPAQLRNCLDTSASAGVIADVVASEFVADPLIRQKLLEEPLLERRLRMLLRYLTQNGE